MPNLLKVGKNCESIEEAEKVSFLIDGKDYFHAVREAIKNARHSVYILSWDINSELVLERERVDDPYPVILGDFLNEIAAAKKELDIYILSWDFAALFTLDRELLPVYKLDWKTHDRVHFSLDNQQPSGASQHQKVVVVDNSVAFVGGLDLTKGRWDTQEHLPKNSKRDVKGGEIVVPYHDVQIMLSGSPAGSLGKAFRDDWFKATGKTIQETEAVRSDDVWPVDVPVDIQNTNLGICYTLPEFNGCHEKMHIQHLYEDAICTAKNYVFIQNQYFTTPIVGNAIKALLEKEKGPEIIFVFPKATAGWLSQYTMDVLRIRLLRELKKADVHERLKVYYPDGEGLQESPINVHAKVMIVDDTFVTVGSANLNNRSMALDKECNIAIDSEMEHVRDGIVGFRNRLFAETLGCSPEEISEVYRKEHSLLKTIESLNHSERRFLHELPLILPKEVDEHVPDINIVDPEHPIEMEKLLKELVPEEEQEPTSRRIISWGLFFTFVFLLVAVVDWMPLKEWATLESASAAIDEIQAYSMAPVMIVLMFVVAGLVAFPLSLLIIASSIAFGPLGGFLYSFVGGLLSAVSTYGVGYYTGRKTVRKLAGDRLNRISKKLAKHGLLTIVTIRVVPVAPFTIINLVAGASHIKFRDYVIGTALGMAPGMAAIVLLTETIGKTIKQPNLTHITLLTATVGAVVIAGYVLVKWLMKKRKEHA